MQAEYLDEVKTCSDCGATLVESSGTSTLLVGAQGTVAATDSETIAKTDAVHPPFNPVDIVLRLVTGGALSLDTFTTPPENQGPKLRSDASVAECDGGEARRNRRLDITTGAFCVFMGGAFSIATWAAAAPGEAHLVAVAPISYGIVRLVRGLQARQSVRPDRSPAHYRARNKITIVVAGVMVLVGCLWILAMLISLAIELVYSGL